MAKHVGLDPNEDIEWVVPPDGNAMELFADGKTDAFLGFPPEPQELRARGFSRVILSTLSDRPWSQYFCCMIYGNRAWVRDHPVATKRFLRAVFKAAAFCQAEPETRRATARRWRVRAALRLRARDDPGAALRALARVRLRRIPALLRAAPARGGHAHFEPERAPRRGHRLALRQRAQARAEGVSHAHRAGHRARAAGVAGAGARMRPSTRSTRSGCRRSGRRPTSP